MTSASNGTPPTGTLQLAVIPGDGIGQEVTAEALKVLEVASPAGVKFEQTRYDLGAERYLATGESALLGTRREMTGRRKDGSLFALEIGISAVTSEMLGGLERRKAARHSFVLPEALRHAAIKNTLRWEFERSQKTLVHRMGEGPFLMGEVMTVPDIILTHCGNWALSAKFPIVEHRLTEYLDRMRQRPAYRRAMAR